METIRKKICTDKLLSHRNGIVPYIKKDSEDTDITYVKTISDESNYGSFPCDFTFIDSHEVFDKETGISYRENVEISRLRYLDVISMYSRCKEIINNGIVLKKVHYTEGANSCDDNNSESEIGIEQNEHRAEPTPDTEPQEPSCSTDWAWIEDTSVSKFTCAVVDSSFLVKHSSGMYFLNDDYAIRYNNLTEQYGLNLDEYIELASEEDVNFGKKYLRFIGGRNENGIVLCNDYILLIDDYDEYFKCENRWNSWWETNWPLCSFHDFYLRWEYYVFDPLYHEPVSLKFIYDIEKYVLGKVSVPESYGGIDIEGTKVPEYVFYLNYMDYLRWFTENEPFLDSNETINREWNKRGGRGLRNFLFTISPVFFDENINPTHGDVVYFTFTVPNIEIPISLCNEFYNETSYLPYEYSVVDNNIVNGTVEYVCGRSGRTESALTPNFVYFNGIEGPSGETPSGYTIEETLFPCIANVESKLAELTCDDVYYIDDNVYGVFNEFTNGGCLFNCVFYTGRSVGEVSKYTSGCVKYYAKTSANTWNEIKTVKIPEQYVSTTTADVMPKTHAGAYQVVGITFIESSMTVSNGSVVNSPTCYNDDGKLKIVSSITTYNKTVRRKYSWCECKKVTNPSVVPCGDGENIDFNGIVKYRNLLLLSCVPSASESTNDGDSYYYMVKYDNGYTNIGGNKEINFKTNSVKSLSLPYIIGREMNRESYSGEFTGITKYDKVIKEEVVGDNIVIDYVIGATVGDDIETSGIHYRDIYPYYGNVTKKVVIDGVYDAEILYEKVSLTGKQLVYSEDLNAYRKCVISEITGMEVGTQWTSESSIRAYLFTDDTFDNLMEYPKIDVSISYNRGNAAAWEKHFKLSECNTFEDLENYGNNYFNL